MLVNIERDELNTILAALRYWQGNGMTDPMARDDWFQAIACPTDNDTSLNSSSVDELCVKLNCGHSVETPDSASLREVLAVLEKTATTLERESPGAAECGYWSRADKDAVEKAKRLVAVDSRDREWTVQEMLDHAG